MSALVCAGLLGGCGAQTYRSQLVSVNRTGTGSGTGVSDHPSFSPDGTKVVFDSTATNLHALDTNAGSDIFLRDLSTGTTRLISVNAAGTGPSNRQSRRPVFSPDGTKVAFVSSATNLGPPTSGGDVNSNVFVRDLTTNTTSLVSANVNGTGGPLISDEPVFSPDGTKIAFRSNASDLVPTDTNTTYDLFVRDLAAGTTELLTVNQQGTDSAEDTSGATPGDVVFGPDSDTVLFDSWAIDMVPGDTNSDNDVFLRDLGAGTTRLVSTSSSGVASGAGSFNPAISSDGTLVAFESHATNLDATVTDTNGAVDIYVKDLATDATNMASVNAFGTAAGSGGESRDPVFRPGTHQLAFQSGARNLTTNSGNALLDIFLRDLDTETNTLVTKSSAANRSANGFSALPVFNASGSQLAFNTSASDLGATDTNGTTDVYVKDLPDGAISLVSLNSAGTGAGNDASFSPTFQPGSTRIAIVSWASNLAAPDTDGNEDEDIFLAAVVPTG